MAIFYTDSASFDRVEVTSSLFVSGTFILSGSFNVSDGGLSGSLLGTASYATQALTASYVQVFPYTGSAIISGSLEVTGGFSVDRDATINNVSIGRGAGTPDSASLNLAIGSGSLISNTTGVRNVAVGNLALNQNTTGGCNTAIGFRALLANTVGKRNTAIGYSAFSANISGRYSVAIGSEALTSNTEGDQNLAVGYGALRANTTGGCNTAVGNDALRNNLSGVLNTAVGRYALCNTTGNRNTAIGFQAGRCIRGSNNVILGSYTGSGDVTASSNNIFIADGQGSLRLFITGSNGLATFFGTGGVSASAFTGSLSGTASWAINVVNGGSAPTVADEGTAQGTATFFNFTGAGVTATVSSNTASIDIPGGSGQTFPYTGSAIISGSLQVTGSFSTDRDATINSLTVGKGGNNIGTNTAVGNKSLKNNSNLGGQNTAVGYQSLYCNTNGSHNVAVGNQALRFNTGVCNVGIGSYTLQLNTAGLRNTAVGSFSSRGNTTGCFNTAVGTYALRYNTTGCAQVAIGYQALRNSNFAATSANANVAVGYRALCVNTTGASNTAIGTRALELNTTGASNVAIGLQSLNSNTIGNCNLALGFRAGCVITTGNNNVFLGSYTGSAAQATQNNNIFISDGTGSLRLFITGSDGLATFFGTGGVSASAFTGSLLGTASFAVSASWAPGGSGASDFPYTGSAIISGSLQITGSIFVSNTGSDDVFIKIKNDDASIAGQAALNIRNDLENGIEVGVKTSNYLTLPDGLLDGNDSFIINNGGQLYIGNNSSGNAAAIKFYANPGFPPFFPPDLALTITGSDTIVVNLFATGSLYGTASWATNVVNGATSDPFPYTGSAIISGSLIVTGSARVLGDGNDGFESFGNINDYFEIFAQNRNSGISASSDIVAYNDQGNKTQNYVDMGINSSGISPTYSFGKANDAYVYNTGGDLFIGNSTAFYQPTRPSQSLHLFANGPGRPDLTITGSRIGIQKSGSLNATLDVLGNVMISGALHITGSADAELKVLGESQFTGSIRVTNGIIAQSVTASLQGSASYALTASFALNAGGGSGFPFEGEAVITGSLIILTGSAIFPLLTASEALTAGDFVNITTGGVRKASNDDVTKQAHGFVVQAYSATENVNVYYNGINPIITGLSIGARYFLGTSGGETVTPPTAAGSLSQEVGVAVSSTAILVNFGPGIIT